MHESGACPEITACQSYAIMMIGNVASYDIINGDASRFRRQRRRCNLAFAFHAHVDDRLPLAIDLRPVEARDFGR